MGRRDAVQFTHECVAEWRRLGAEVTFEPGWETRSNGSAPNYEGVVVHHTGIGSSEASPFPGRNVLLNGRPDLKGPLCNSAGPWCPPDRPRIHVIAANPANHAGASGGRSMGPLPVTGSFNPRVWGHEVDYGGNVPMSPGQYKAALIVAKGVANVLGRSIEYVRAHAETSITGKWDPGYATGKTIDMAAFRRDAANLTEDDMSTDAEDRIRNIERALGAEGAATLPLPVSRSVLAVQWAIQDSLTKALPLLLKGADVDEAAIVEGLKPLILSSVVPAVASAFREEIGGGVELDEERLGAITEDALRRVLGGLDAPTGPTT